MVLELITNNPHIENISKGGIVFTGVPTNYTQIRDELGNIPIYYSLESYKSDGEWHAGTSPNALKARIRFSHVQHINPSREFAVAEVLYRHNIIDRDVFMKVAVVVIKAYSDHIQENANEAFKSENADFMRSLKKISENKADKDDFSRVVTALSNPTIFNNLSQSQNLNREFSGDTNRLCNAVRHIGQHYNETLRGKTSWQFLLWEMRATEKGSLLEGAEEKNGVDPTLLQRITTILPKELEDHVVSFIDPDYPKFNTQKYLGSYVQRQKEKNNGFSQPYDPETTSGYQKIQPSSNKTLAERLTEQRANTPKTKSVLL